MVVQTMSNFVCLKIEKEELTKKIRHILIEFRNEPGDDDELDNDRLW
jgi:hypothetical protein